jgi:catechol 2,3-dioxygenase-like lactoylglutathione lyase family enzyme
MATTPLAVAHIGITVPDLDAAIAWYGAVMGFRPIGPAGTVELDDGSHFGQLCTDVFGAHNGIKKIRMVHLSSANGTALELFEFVEPRTIVPDDNFEFRRIGIFHFCVINPDVAGLAQRIEKTGGKIRSKVWDLFEDQPYQLVYCQDPWGTIIEIYSHSHEQFFANQA